MITEKEVIAKLQMLKNITPNKDWASLVKSEVLGKQFTRNTPFVPATFTGLNSIFTYQKFAYALSAVLVIFAGVFGLSQFISPVNAPTIKNNTQQLQASLTREVELKNSVEAFKKTLAVRPVTLKKTSEAVKQLAVVITNNPSSAKDIAVELKNDGTLSALEGSVDAKDTSDILYEALDRQMIADLEKATLLDNQKKVLVDIKALFDKKDFAGALEKILSINNSAVSK